MGGVQVYFNEDEYWKRRPEAQRINPSLPNYFYYPYFLAQRNPANDEIQNNIIKQDYISYLLYESNIEYSNIARCLIYFEACGDSNSYREIYQLRPFWAVYLAITNNTGKEILLRTLNCYEPEHINQSKVIDSW